MILGVPFGFPLKPDSDLNGLWSSRLGFVLMTTKHFLRQGTADFPSLRTWLASHRGGRERFPEAVASLFLMPLPFEVLAGHSDSSARETCGGGSKMETNMDPGIPKMAVGTQKMIPGKWKQRLEPRI